jgi:hypothetical protein
MQLGTLAAAEATASFMHWLVWVQVLEAVGRAGHDQRAEE